LLGHVNTLKELSMTNTTDSQPTLTLQDVANMIQFISVMSGRGAIKPTELSSVGDLYDRLVLFLKAAGVEVEESEKITEKDPT
jgi:hypothetical protein